MRARAVRLFAVAVVALFGLGAGCIAGLVPHGVLPRPAAYPFLAEYVPLPHHVPKRPGGAALRFAMVHDVLHERFAKHGPDHYRERNRRTRQKLAKLSPDNPASFPLIDDLAVGLDRLGQFAEAATLMRDKLARQQAKGGSVSERYTSYANLGTFLMHASQARAVAGDKDAREQFREGVSFIRTSADVNPDAHFGREQWQVVIGEFLLAAMEDPSLLKKFDFVGNRLDLKIEQILDRELNWIHTGYGRPTSAAFSQGKVVDEIPTCFEPGHAPDDLARWPAVSPVRQHITKVGAEDGWDKVPIPSHRSPVPFDEPVLGMVGIWRQGSGANPHFCLALGETMLRVGQRYLAWAAYERAVRLADRFWPDAELRQFLCDHCRRRQGEIEETLTYQRQGHRLPWQHVSPPPPEGTVAELRPKFEAEIGHGEGYQCAYQKYEAEKITAGVPIMDEHFFADFHAARGPIATAPGAEEWFAFVPRGKMREYAERRKWAWGMAGGGLAALGAALLLRWRSGEGKEAGQPA